MSVTRGSRVFFLFSFEVPGEHVPKNAGWSFPCCAATGATWAQPEDNGMKGRGVQLWPMGGLPIVNCRARTTRRACQRTQTGAFVQGPSTRILKPRKKCREKHPKRQTDSVIILTVWSGDVPRTASEPPRWKDDVRNALAHLWKKDADGR